MTRFSDEFLRALPKTDLHLHLDGSLRIETLIELAHDAGVALPAETVQGLRETVFKDQYASLEEYLRGFALTTAVMQSDAALFRVAYELMLDNAAEGVRYIEVRFAPQLLMSEKMSYGQVMDAVDRGLRTARDELNARHAAGVPEYDYGLIVCAMRSLAGPFSVKPFTQAKPTAPRASTRRSPNFMLNASAMACSCLTPRACRTRASSTATPTSKP